MKQALTRQEQYTSLKGFVRKTELLEKLVSCRMQEFKFKDIVAIGNTIYISKASLTSTDGTEMHNLESAFNNCTDLVGLYPTTELSKLLLVSKTYFTSNSLGLKESDVTWETVVVDNRSYVKIPPDLEEILTGWDYVHIVKPHEWNRHDAVILWRGAVLACNNRKRRKV